MAVGPKRDFLTRAPAESLAVDAGLRTFMQKVYGFMAGGLGATGLVAYFVASNEAVKATVYPLHFVLMLATLGLVFFFSFRLHKIQASTAQAIFWAYAVLNGMWLAPIFDVYTGASIARTFFITGGTFLAMSLYGYTTKRDLSGWGNFLIMGVIGLIIASVVNIFLASSALDFAISVIGVLAFTGLTAYDTQKIKEFYWEADGAEIVAKKAILGALTLYLDFINLFLFMLRFLGNRE